MGKFAAPHRRPHFRQFTLFLLGGGASALLDVGLMQLLIINGVHYQGAASAGFGAALLANYAFHTRLTFAATPSSFNFARFLCVVALNYALTMLCVGASVNLAGNALAGKLVALPLVALTGFLLGKYWIYR